MTNLLIKWLINAAALLVVAYAIPGIVVSGFFTALLLALALGFLNIFIRPILFILTLPITLLTFGLFSLIINGFLFWFAARFLEGFTVTNLGVAIIGAFVFGILTFLGEHLLIKKDDDDKE